MSRSTVAVFTGGTPTSQRPYGSTNLGLHVGDDPVRVDEARARLGAGLGVPLAFMEQVHGAAVALVDGPPGRADVPPQADALVTTAPGLGLVVMVADCVPLLLADEAAGVVAAVHAGRAGVVAGVVPAALTAMAALGATDVRAWVGPSICGRCYEVGDVLRDEVAAVTPEAAASTWAGTAGVDCSRGVQAQLRAAGVGDVRVDPRCTYETVDLFSHRRSRPTGRQAGVVVLR